MNEQKTTQDDDVLIDITPFGVMIQIVGEAKARDIMRALSAAALQRAEDGMIPAMIFNKGGRFISIEPHKEAGQ